MPYDIRIIRSREFLRLGAEGHFDLLSTRKLFCDAIWACVRGKIGRVLVDVRDATTDLTAAQLGALANVCREVSPPAEGHKIAILNRPQHPFDRASFLAALAQGQGWNIAAFCEFEKAFEWLSD